MYYMTTPLSIRFDAALLARLRRRAWRHGRFNDLRASATAHR